MYLGVDELIAELEVRGIDHGILTYASDTANQQFKLDMWHHFMKKTHDRVEAIITTKDKKAEWVESHWHDKGSSSSDPKYIVPSTYSDDDTISARYILIVDDKFKNIRSDHKHIIGFRVDNSADSPTTSSGSIIDLVDIVQQGRLDEYVQAKSVDA